MNVPSDEEESDEEILPASPAIKWHSDKDKSARPKAKLMPSFTRKSLEFHNCPEPEIMKRKPGNINS